MRISVVGPVHPYRGGIAHHTTLLVRALSERHEVQVISFRRQYPAFLYPGRTDRDPSDQPLQLGVSARYPLDPLYPWTWWAAAQEIGRFAPHLVVIQWWTTFWAPPFAALASRLRDRGLAPLFLVHNVMPHEPRPWDAWLARLALTKGRAFVAQSDREKLRLLELVPGAAVSVCAHPVYDMLAGQRVPRAEARRRLGLPAEVSVALFFGIVRPYKGLKYLIEAAGILRGRGAGTHLVIAGEFWEDRRGYEEQIARLDLTGQVLLVDRYIPNEDVAVFFSAADLFVAPYIGGTQSGAVNMALGFGLPVVTTNGEWLSSAGGDAGLCVPVADSRALAEAIAEIHRRPRRREAEGSVTHRTASGWQALVGAIEGWAAR